MQKVVEEESYHAAGSVVRRQQVGLNDGIGIGNRTKRILVGVTYVIGVPFDVVPCIL